MKVLFVDDESMVLDGLRNLLRAQRHQWSMTFVDSAEAALEALASEAFDVLVTDIRMPKLDGVELLKLAHREHPEIVRIVLSGYAQDRSAVEALFVGHQFLCKPCPADKLAEVIERACSLKQLVSNSQLVKMVGGIDQLPSLPRVYAALSQALANPRVRPADVAAIVEQDVAMCAKTLQIVNSAFFGLPRRIAKIEEAVVYLGFEVIRNLALSIEVFRAASDGTSVGPGMDSLETLQRHSLMTGAIARWLSCQIRGPQASDDGFMGGMLHDIGCLIVGAQFGHESRRLAEAAETWQIPFHEAESKLWGVSHAEIGAYLLGIWGLPYQLVEAVANHHAPARVPSDEFDLPGMVHVADSLAAEIDPSLDAERGPQLDLDYLERMGVLGELDRWRDHAKVILEQTGIHQTGADS